MKVLSRTSDGLKRCYNVLITPDEVEQVKTKRLQEIAKQMKMDGFRPGKVPLDVARRIYGDSVTNESKEETDVYTPNRPAKRSKSLLTANAALAVYWFTSDGQGSKKMLEKENKTILCTPLYAGTGDRFYFLAMSSIYPHICTVTLPSNQ